VGIKPHYRLAGHGQRREQVRLRLHCQRHRRKQRQYGNQIFRPGATSKTNSTTVAATVTSVNFLNNDLSGYQEPGTNAEIKAQVTERFHVTFDLYAKIKVNGDDADPLFQYLQEKIAGEGGKSPIEWNFAKFLVNRNGVPVKRYGPKTLPFCFEGDILKVIDGSFGPEDAKVKNTTGDCV